MSIRIQNASEHNLKGIDVEFGDGLTVVTGVSGSGKTSLVFDTLYHESKRRFFETFSLSSPALRLPPARVGAITGLGPAVAVDQNTLNRNPLSTVATASGLHPFFRLLFARLGKRHCARCGTGLTVLTDDEIVRRLLALVERQPVTILASLLRGVQGSHRTLLQLLVAHFGAGAVLVNGRPYTAGELDPEKSHDIEVEIARLSQPLSAGQVRQVMQMAAALGAHVLSIHHEQQSLTFARAPVCVACGAGFSPLEPKHFHTSCPHCQGDGCPRCDGTGLHPEAAAVSWRGLRLPDLLARSIDEVSTLLAQEAIPGFAARLNVEIERRLKALVTVGLGYLQLNRPSPTLSRGEAQRLRLAIILTSRLEDMIHVLDEPTVGQHPDDVARLLPTLRQLAGPVVYVEHDRLAATAADQAIELGPGAGHEGGDLVFTGTPAELWQSNTTTGRYFSLRQRVPTPDPRPKPETFLVVRGAHLHNLQHIDVSIPRGRLTVISGVSGSGKSTLVEDVLVRSLTDGEAVGCQALEGPLLKPILVDQTPIGRNPRSTPATYTKLATTIRDYFSEVTGLPASSFSFNRPEGACPACKGIGAVEVRMRYLPSTWVQCSACDGRRFSDQVLAVRADFDGRRLTIADFYELTIAEATPLLLAAGQLSPRQRRAARRILKAMTDIGLGYLRLGQPSPTLSGGEAQRVKLARYLGRPSLTERLLVLDEPSTGLHPKDVIGLLTVLDRLTRAGATIVVVEHNLDIIRAADWIIDLGPGAGPAGGRVLYTGEVAGLTAAEVTKTGQALREEAHVRPRPPAAESQPVPAPVIAVRKAQAHNLKGVSVAFPKRALTVVTGVSGSGKSSLVGNVLEAEARRRFLETLSMYERQSTREGPEAPVESVTGLGVTVAIESESNLYNPRATVGTVTELLHHLSVLFARIGQRACPACGAAMVRAAQWHCPACQTTAPIAGPRHFSPTTYGAACQTCSGVGTLQEPNPQKLIVHPEKPLCDGAMYSPGFFPRGYMCKPLNGGYDMLQALAARYEFDPATTPWNQMTAAAQQAFLYGDPDPLTVTFHSRTGKTTTKTVNYTGFYGLIRDWDTAGTYLDFTPCPDCQGARLRPEYLAVTLAGHNIHAMSEMTLSALRRCWKQVSVPEAEARIVGTSYRTVARRLRFLQQVGLSYLHLNRPTATLSAGEAQRIKLATLLGSELTSLTILLDEPTRGLHPAEVSALLQALAELRDEGNTVIVVEHDPQVIYAADHVVDLGPGAGVAGGEIVAQGRPQEVAQAHTITGRWLRHEGQGDVVRTPRTPRGWLSVYGAVANNLQGNVVRFPLGTLTGVCGVSGSGKSTLLIDTVGKALAPKKHTTSVARELVEPGEHQAIEGAPRRTIMVDQAKAGVTTPAAFLNLGRFLRKLYAAADEAQALGLDEGQLSRRCSVCKGRGATKIDMGFLPAVYSPCETCRGTGYLPEAWEVRLRGYSLPDLMALTIDEVYDLWQDEEKLATPLSAARDVGLGYLVLSQPGHTLSGGEAQRLKIAKELCRKTFRETLYILDEPTVGQHLADVARLTGILHRLVDAGHTVLVIEHHAPLLAACDWLVEFGPGGGPDGGRIVAAGPPDAIAAKETATAPYLRQILEVER